MTSETTMSLAATAEKSDYQATILRRTENAKKKINFAITIRRTKKCAL